MREFSTWLNKDKSYECRFSGSHYEGQIMNILWVWGISVQNSSKSVLFCFVLFSQLVIACLAIFIVILVIRPIIQGQKWGEGAGINVG